jgi:hypothetical protein
VIGDHVIKKGYREKETLEALFYCTFYALFYFGSRLAILRESKSALKALRAMPNNTAEVKPPVFVAAGLLP